MPSEQNKKIILGITGSIAAYKSAVLTRLLVKSGYDVRVIMTNSAKSFITPLTLSTLSKSAVHSSIADDETWNDHVALGLWADAMLIAPCTANTLGKIANGLADNMLVASYLSAKCPVYIAPAMDLDMWTHGSTKANLAKLESYGDEIIPVGHGELASGLVGDGRMAEPEDILAFLNNKLNQPQDLAGKKVLVTAGPTYEKLDPVRYIGNHSSGKMGIALAEVCAQRGADVILVQGPGSISAQHSKIQTIRVFEAKDMYHAVLEHYQQQDIAIFAAAVADYTPATFSEEKIKKKDGDLSIPLERTKDIAAKMGQLKQANQINVGFALETENELANAKRKVKKKNFDLIVLNSLRNKGAGFKKDTNQVTIINKNGDITEYSLKSKKKVAEDIVNTIVAIKSK